MTKSVEQLKDDLGRFLDLVDGEVMKLRTDGKELIAFDLGGIALMNSIVRHVIFKNVNRCNLSAIQLARMTKQSDRQVRYRLKRLAHYGLIRVETPWRKDGSGLRSNSQITVNPLVLGCVRGSGHDRIMSRKDLILVAQELAKLGVARDEIEGDVQGFKVDCAYGEPEPGTVAAEADMPMESLDEASCNEAVLDSISKADTTKADKRKEQALWRDRSHQFVQAAAELWVFAQSELGNGIARPNWEGELAVMSPTAKRERSELVKTFQRYGGRVTALAWYVFAGGIVQKDKKGNIKFDLIHPHRQFATVDKKPSQFSKHFNAVLKDRLFVLAATRDWADIGLSLREYFGDLLDVSPKDDTEYSLIGFEFGVWNNS